MTTEEMAELRETLAKAEGYCKLLDQIGTVDDRFSLDITVQDNRCRNIDTGLARQIFNAGVVALRQQTEDQLAQLQINKPKDEDKPQPGDDHDLHRTDREQDGSCQPPVPLGHGRLDESRALQVGR